MIAIKPFPRLFQSKSSFASVGSIGLDFALEKINLVQLGVLTEGGLALKSVSSHLYETSREALLTSPKLLRATIRKALQTNDFSGKKVVSSIPPDEVRIISINYPNTKNSTDTSSIIQAIKERIDDDLSNYVIDYMPVRAHDSDSDQLAIVALVENKTVTKYLDAMRYAGLVVEALEIRPSAINRYVYSVLENKEYQNILSINFGVNKSYLTITSGRRLLFDRQVEFGSSQLINEISHELDIPIDSVKQLVEKHGFGEDGTDSMPKLVYDEGYAKTLLSICKPKLEKLLDEANRALLFLASENHGQSINKIYLFGSMSYWRGLNTYLQEELKVEIETIKNPLEKVNDPYECLKNNNVSYTAELSIAIGHALRGLV
jgi:type IV pilus assembly protein PilM